MANDRQDGEEQAETDHMGEGAGAGTGVPVWCDGASWRTCHDNSVVAA